MAVSAEVVDKMSALITAAFGLVAALAWNGAIQAIFKEVFGTPEGMVPMISYAIIVTVVAVVATLWIGRAASRAAGIAEKAKEIPQKMLKARNS